MIHNYASRRVGFFTYSNIAYIIYVYHMIQTLRLSACMFFYIIAAVGFLDYPVNTILLMLFKSHNFSWALSIIYVFSEIICICAVICQIDQWNSESIYNSECTYEQNIQHMPPIPTHTAVPEQYENNKQTDMYFYTLWVIPCQTYQILWSHP